MRGFIHELQEHQESGAKIGEVHQFVFGCQTPDALIYEDELRALKETGALTKLHFAFSRTNEKQHVQHVRRRNAALSERLTDISETDGFS